MTLSEFVKQRDALLLESIHKEDEMMRVLNKKRQFAGLGEDPPEVRAIAKEYNAKITALWETVEDKP